MSASASVKAAERRAWRSNLARRAPAIVAVVLVLLGVIAVAVRLDAPSDGTAVSLYRTDGVVVDVPSPVDGPGLRPAMSSSRSPDIASPMGWAALPARSWGRSSGTTSCATA